MMPFKIIDLQSYFWILATTKEYGKHLFGVVLFHPHSILSMLLKATFVESDTVINHQGSYCRHSLQGGPCCPPSLLSLWSLLPKEASDLLKR